MMLTQWMNPDLLTVAPNETTARCRDRVVDESIRHVFVVDHGKLIGMLDAAMLRYSSADVRTVGELPLLNPETVELPSTPVELVERLLDCEHDVVAVTDGGRLVGSVSEHDVVTVAADQLPHGVDVRRYLTPWLATIEGATTVLSAREQFRAEQVRHLVITSNGELYAVLSWRDLIGQRPDRTVAECVRPVQWRGGVEDGMRSIAAKMARHGIGLLPITEPDGNLVGVISRVDVIRALQEHLR